MGFTIFITLSLGITLAVTRHEMRRAQEQQHAAAVRTLLGLPEEHTPWWR